MKAHITHSMENNKEFKISKKLDFNQESFNKGDSGSNTGVIGEENSDILDNSNINNSDNNNNSIINYNNTEEEEYISSIPNNLNSSGSEIGNTSNQFNISHLIDIKSPVPFIHLNIDSDLNSELSLEEVLINSNSLKNNLNNNSNSNNNLVNLDINNNNNSNNSKLDTQFNLDSSLSTTTTSPNIANTSTNTLKRSGSVGNNSRKRINSFGETQQQSISSTNHYINTSSLNNSGSINSEIESKLKPLNKNKSDYHHQHKSSSGIMGSQNNINTYNDEDDEDHQINKYHQNNNNNNNNTSNSNNNDIGAIFTSPHHHHNNDEDSDEDEENDIHQPLTQSNFYKLYESHMANIPKKKFVYIFPIWLEEKLRKFDDPIIRFCQFNTGKTMYYISLFITALVAVEIAMIAPFFLFILGQDTLATEFTYLALLLSLISQVPKRFLWRFRPYMVKRAKTVKKDMTSSFPSRAVTCSVVYSYAVIWIATYYQNHESTIVEWWMPVMFVTWVLLSSFARINLGVHYPSDCVGGVIQGALVCIIGTAFRKVDIVGCRSCWDGTCYAPLNSNQEITFGHMDRLNFIMLVSLFLIFLVVPIVSTMKPVDFWSKCDRVYGMLFPAIAFQLLLLCPSSYHLGGSLPPPHRPRWYSYLFGGILALCATLIPAKVKIDSKYSIITFWILFLTLSISLFSWRLGQF